MTISRFQAEIVAVLSHNRSSKSFFSGSLVLDRYLVRPIGDLDIHCVAENDYVSAISADLERLRVAGIHPFSLQRQEIETEVRLKRNDDLATVNWVITGNPYLCGPIVDMTLGWRTTIADAIVEKLQMAQTSDRQKHFNDLAICANAGICRPELILIAASCQSSSRLFDRAQELILEITRSPKLEAAARLILKQAAMNFRQIVDD